MSYSKYHAIKLTKNSARPNFMGERVNLEKDGGNPLWQSQHCPRTTANPDAAQAY